MINSKQLKRVENAQIIIGVLIIGALSMKIISIKAFWIIFPLAFVFQVVLFLFYRKIGMGNDFLRRKGGAIFGSLIILAILFISSQIGF